MREYSIIPCGYAILEWVVMLQSDVGWLSLSWPDYFVSSALQPFWILNLRFDLLYHVIHSIISMAFPVRKPFFLNSMSFISLSVSFWPEHPGIFLWLAFWMFSFLDHSAFWWCFFWDQPVLSSKRRSWKYFWLGLICYSLNLFPFFSTTAIDGLFPFGFAWSATRRGTSSRSSPAWDMEYMVKAEAQEITITFCANGEALRVDLGCLRMITLSRTYAVRTIPNATEITLDRQTFFAIILFRTGRAIGRFARVAIGVY